MSISDMLILALATWRLAYMLVYEDGLFDVFDRIRRVANNREATGKLLSCVWCCSVWTAGGVLLLWQFDAGRVIVYVLALSALAITLHVIIERLKDGNRTGQVPGQE